MFSASLSKNKSYFIVVEGNNKDHEFNAFFLELGCEQVSLYSVISSTKKYGPSDLPIRRFDIFMLKEDVKY